MDNLKKYIYENIGNYEHNHNDIIDFIKNNNINYSQNANGIFVNISKLSDSKLKEIKLLMTSKSFSLDLERNTIINNMEKSIVNEVVHLDEEVIEDNKQVNTFKKISINNDIEKKIINYSVVYKLNEYIGK